MQRTRLISTFMLITLIGVVLFGVTPTPLYAATFTVNTTGDVGDNNTSNGVCDSSPAAGLQCTLRAAIEQANALAGADTIAFSGVTLINTTSQLNISSQITINGTGVTVDGSVERAFHVLSSATVIVNGLTITGSGSASELGSGFYVQGSLTLQNGAVVTGNTAEHGGGILAFSSGQVIIRGTGTAITGNTATNSGGGVYLLDGADLFLQDGAVISNHTGVPRGAGVYVDEAGSSVTVDNATISGNTATLQGGGIYALTGAVVRLQNGAVMSGNTATASTGGAIHVSNVAGLFSVGDTRFESNTAGGNGDAIYYARNSAASITHSCFTNNGDTAVFNAGTNILTASGGGDVALSSWWGTDWGPRIAGAGAGTGSEVSNGDSISGNGTSVGSNSVDVSPFDASDHTGVPTGAWLTSVPTIGGVTCQVCTDVSSLGHGRTCS